MQMFWFWVQFCAVYLEEQNVQAMFTNLFVNGKIQL